VDIAGAINTIISFSGLILGSTYVIGGLIVNLHLSAYGITQYQILRTKYLAVGLTYLTNFLAVIALAAIPAIFLINSNFFIQQLFLIASLLASVFLLWLWGKTTFRKRSVLFSWRSWVALGTIAFIYPLMVTIRLGLILGLDGQINYESAISAGQAILAILLSFMGSIYYYARHLYGRQNVIFGSVDPIGMGIPIPVQLAGESENISLLAKLGVPLLQPETTDKILLLDETNTHYIVGISNQEETRAVEVTKDMVKAIRYY
jgi:hypothetical protein